MKTFYDIVRELLPPFVEGAEKRLTGTIAVPAGTGSVTVTGTGTKFRQQLKTGDEFVVWGEDSDNIGQILEVTTITSNTELTANSPGHPGTGADLVAESGLYGAKVGNIILQGIKIMSDLSMADLDDDLRTGIRSAAYALRQLAREWMLYPGGWEDATQLAAFLARLFEIHQRRGTEGYNMYNDDDDIDPITGERGWGILGECDRLTHNPGTSEILTDLDLGWTLAGDIHFDIDPVTGGATPSADVHNLTFTYPDFSVPSAAHPLGEYSPGDEAFCYIGIIEAILIRLYQDNEEYKSERAIEEIVRHIVPLEIPHFVQWL